jgi:hypothetical protein
MGGDLFVLIREHVVLTTDQICSRHARYYFPPFSTSIAMRPICDDSAAQLSE